MIDTLLSVALACVAVAVTAAWVYAAWVAGCGYRAIEALRDLRDLL